MSLEIQPYALLAVVQNRFLFLNALVVGALGRLNWSHLTRFLDRTLYVSVVYEVEHRCGTRRRHEAPFPDFD